MNPIQQKNALPSNPIQHPADSKTPSQVPSRDLSFLEYGLKSETFNQLETSTHSDLKQKNIQSVSSEDRPNEIITWLEDSRASNDKEQRNTGFNERQERQITSPNSDEYLEKKYSISRISNSEEAEGLKEINLDLDIGSSELGDLQPTPDKIQERLQQFEKKLDSLLNEHIEEKPKGFWGVFTQIKNIFFKSSAHDEIFEFTKLAAQISAETLSKGELKGFNWIPATRFIIDTLEMLDTPNAQEVNSQLKHSMASYPKRYIKKDIRKESLRKKATEAQIACLSLENNQSLLFAAFSPDHSALLSMKCIQNELGQKQFIATVFNEGSAASDFHYSHSNDGGKFSMQRIFEIENVSPENIQNSDFFFHLFSLIESTDSDPHSALYLKILPLLGGKLAAPSNDPRAWGKTQLGENCGFKSPLAYLRTHLTQSEMTQFMLYARLYLISRLYEVIKHQKQASILTESICLQIIDKILEGKGKTLLPSKLYHQLNEVKQEVDGLAKRKILASRENFEKELQFKLKQLQQGKTASLNGIELSTLKNTYETNGLSIYDLTIEDRVNVAFSYLQLGDLEKVYSVLVEDAGEIRRLLTPLAPERYEKCKQILSLILNYVKTGFDYTPTAFLALTRMSTYLSLPLSIKITELPLEHPDRSLSLDFVLYILHKYNLMRLNEKTAQAPHLIDPYLDFWFKGCYTGNERYIIESYRGPKRLPEVEQALSEVRKSRENTSS